MATLTTVIWWPLDFEITGDARKRKAFRHLHSSLPVCVFFAHIPPYNWYCARQLFRVSAPNELAPETRGHFCEHSLTISSVTSRLLSRKFGCAWYHVLWTSEVFRPAKLRLFLPFRPQSFFDVFWCCRPFLAYLCVPNEHHTYRINRGNSAVFIFGIGARAQWKFLFYLRISVPPSHYESSDQICIPVIT